MRHTIRRTLVAGLAAAALAAPAARARADALEPGTSEGPKTAAKYAGCALGLALAGDPGQALVAFLACYKIFRDEFTQ